MVRRGDDGPVRHFNWMVHPYQLVEGFTGTDGRTPRASIEELVTWLTDAYIDTPDESGHAVARFANAAEMRSAFETWERDFPGEAEELQQAMESGEPPRYLPAILDRMETTYHDTRLDTGDEDLAVHRLIDHDSGKQLLLAWSRTSGEIPLGSVASGRHLVLQGDGTTSEADAADLVAGPEPVLLEPL
jgi:hypothetical protein